MKEAKFKALELLSELESVTRESLAGYRVLHQPEPPPPAASPAPASAKVPPQVTTAHPDYRPALGNPALVEALLKLQPRLQAQRKTPSRSSSRVTPVAPDDWSKLSSKSRKKKNS